MKVSTAEGRSSGPPFDPLSPPSLLGVAYFVLIALGTVDVILDQWFPGLFGYRLRAVVWDFDGLSGMALLYLGIGYLLFVLGYRLKLGKALARSIKVGSGTLSSRRASFVTTIMFSATFGVLVLYTQKVGYGYHQGTGNIQTSLENLSLLGELSLIPYALGVYRFMVSRRRPEERVHLSKWDVCFLWCVMLPLQIGFCVWIGSRWRVVTVVLIALAAYHYGRKRVKARSLVLIATVMMLFASPLMAGSRVAPEARPDVALMSIWESMMSRMSAVETFTATFNYPHHFPQPDPIWLVPVAGLVPRLVWSGKPMSDFGERFSEAAGGSPQGQLAPTLQGELLMHFGYLGGLVAMGGLGIVWRTLFGMLIGAEEGRKGITFIYLTVLPMFLTTTEAGFVLPYSVLVRFLAVGALVFAVVRTR